MREDPRCAEIIKPSLRGQDIKRWSPAWAGLWMILLKSSGDQIWPWSHTPDTAQAEDHFRHTFLSLYGRLKPLEEKLRTRQDRGRYWWELRACAYYHIFEQPKLIHTDITWRSQFALSSIPAYLLNTAYMWPTNDLYLLAVVNSPLLWAYMWRNATRGKDEALRLIYAFVETLPMAYPTDTIRAEAEQAVARLVEITRGKEEFLGKFFIDQIVPGCYCVHLLALLSSRRTSLNSRPVILSTPSLETQVSRRTPA